MAYNSDRSMLMGLAFGVGPGVLIGAIGLALGGEWAWTLGFIGMWLIFIGLFAGPALGSIGPEIIAERPTISGAVVGALPGLVLTILLIGENFWIGVLVMVVGSVLGSLIGHFASKRSAGGTPMQTPIEPLGGL